MCTIVCIYNVQKSKRVNDSDYLQYALSVLSLFDCFAVRIDLWGNDSILSLIEHL